MKTEEKIISQALEMFNERGIEYVGLREIAKKIGIRVSNITYYFPTKDDLVNRLWLDLNALNNKLVVSNDNISMLSFLSMLRSVFQNHVSYRCIMLSFVHLMERNRFISERYKKTGKDRNAILHSNIQSMLNTGYLIEMSKNEIDTLVSTVAIIIRFWISEASISQGTLSADKHISFYLTNLAQLFLPYSTDQGRRDILLFIEEIRK